MKKKGKEWEHFLLVKLWIKGENCVDLILANSVELIGKHIINCIFFFLFRKNSISKKMSCIAHACKCLFQKSLVHLATDFENEYLSML